MLFLADFNREINVKAYTRIIGGKAVPVRGAKRTVMRLKEALEDLRKVTGPKYGTEHAYNMNPKTGIVGQRIIGNSNSVVISSQFSPKHNHYKRTKRVVLHSHPGNTSLSVQDLFTTPRDGNTPMIFNVTPRGSVYRGYLKRGGKFMDKDKVDDHVQKLIPYFYDEMDKFFENTPESKLKELLGDIHNKVSVRLESRNLATHANNLFLKELGVIHYRYKLSDFDKKLCEVFKPQIDAVVKNKAKGATFRIPKDYKGYLVAMGKKDILQKYNVKSHNGKRIEDLIW